MRILVLSASVGSGHMSAAWALETALRELAPEARVRLVDVLEDASPVFRTLYGGGYIGLTSKAPHLVGYLYDRTNGSRAADAAPSLAGRARAALQRAGLPALERLLLSEPWDLVVCTHFLPAEAAAGLKRRGALRARLAVAVTDFDAHRIWAHEPCELYLVATDEAAASLRRFGARGRIAVTGIPVQPAFARLPTASSARRGLGLDTAAPVALLLGGGCGLGPMDELFDALEAVEAPLQVVAVAGRNEALRRRLAARAALSGKGARVLGFTRRMSELMRAADIVVTKPGGLTVSEALACGTPLAIVEPLPGQESRNGDFALENGAAIRVHHPSSLGRKLAELLRRPERLDALKAAARKLGRPVSAFDAAAECLSRSGSGLAAGGARR
jgi:processive 1,2-diacylglycerol beta-glucosyltransferase